MSEQKELRSYKKISKNGRFNKSYYFLLPAFKPNYEEFKKFNLINTYISDHNYDVVYDSHLYLLFEPTEIQIMSGEFQSFIDKIKQSKSYTDEYEVKNGLMIVLKFPDKHKDIINLFIDGKYSQFSKDYVDSYISKFIRTSYNSTKQELSKVWQIISKYPEYKKYQEEKIGQKLDDTAEIYDIPTINEEIFNYNPELLNYVKDNNR